MDVHKLRACLELLRLHYDTLILSDDSGASANVVLVRSTPDPEAFVVKHNQKQINSHATVTDILALADVLRLDPVGVLVHSTRLTRYVSLQSATYKSLRDSVCKGKPRACAFTYASFWTHSDAMTPEQIRLESELTIDATMCIDYSYFSLKPFKDNVMVWVAHDDPDAGDGGVPQSIDRVSAAAVCAQVPHRSEWLCEPTKALSIEYLCSACRSAAGAARFLFSRIAAWALADGFDMVTLSPANTMLRALYTNVFGMVPVRDKLVLMLHNTAQMRYVLAGEGSTRAIQDSFRSCTAFHYPHGLFECAATSAHTIVHWPWVERVVTLHESAQFALQHELTTKFSISQCKHAFTQVFKLSIADTAAQMWIAFHVKHADATLGLPLHARLVCAFALVQNNTAAVYRACWAAPEAAEQLTEAMFDTILLGGTPRRTRSRSTKSKRTTHRKRDGKFWHK